MSKRFIFRYETMLKIRQQREDQQKFVVADRRRQIDQINRQISSLQQQISREMASIRDDCESGTINIQQAIHRRYWLSHLHKSILESEARLGYHEARLAQDRADLTETTKQRRIIETLRQNQRGRHKRLEQNQQTDRANDMATVRYVFDRVNSLESVAR